MKRSLMLALGLLVFLLAGCTTSQHYRSSVVQYLYPEGKEVAQQPEVPVLSLPLRVGIAFVPTEEPGNVPYGIAQRHRGAITEGERMSLMQEVAAHFKQYDYVKGIEIIPSAYLQPKGGFTNLNQLRTMYGIDVIALLSYDQSQFTDEGGATISYWTIIGIYAVKGEKNDTHTMLDAAVFDIESRKMLFRAPGLSHIKSIATPVNLSERQRLDRSEGFKEASRDLIVNLDQQLKLFEEKVKEMPEEFKIIHKPEYQAGSTGGGSIDALMLLGMAGVGIFSLFRRSE